MTGRLLNSILTPATLVVYIYRDSCKQLFALHCLPKLQDWLRLLVRVDPVASAASAAATGSKGDAGQSSSLAGEGSAPVLTYNAERERLLRATVELRNRVQVGDVKRRKCIWC